MSSPPRAPPYLPPEIIDEILRQNDLSLSDLAKCCRVQGTWLDSARKSLYAEISIVIVYGYVHPELIESETGSDDNSDSSRYDGSRLDFGLDDRCPGLLWTLQAYDHLGPFVSALHLKTYDREYTRLFLAEVLSPRKIMRDLVRLCPNVTKLRLGCLLPGQQSWWPPLKPYRVTVTEICMDSIDDEDDWDQLRRFTSLKKLAARRITLDESHPPLPVVHFDARHGDPLSLKAVQTSMGQALRHLRIPVNLVPSLQVLEFPHLRHLAISARGSLDQVASYQFRLDLQKLESLEVFELDDKAFNSIGGGIRRFGETLPLSCRRINLNCTVDNKRSPAIKAIRSLIPHLNEGHLVREVGLEVNAQTWHVSPRHKQELLEVVREVLDAANIELIWRTRPPTPDPE